MQFFERCPLCGRHSLDSWEYHCASCGSFSLDDIRRCSECTEWFVLGRGVVHKKIEKFCSKECKMEGAKNERKSISA